MVGRTSSQLKNCLRRRKTEEETGKLVQTPAAALQKGLC